MVYKNSPMRLAFYAMILLACITIIVGFIYVINGIDPLAYCAFIVSSFSFVASVAIPAEAAMAHNIEKRLEFFYKPIILAIGSPCDIEKRVDDIILKLQDIRQYDHLAKDKHTKDLLWRLTSASETKATQIYYINKLWEVGRSDVKDYEEKLAALYIR
jgi:hypothetical protein